MRIYIHVYWHVIVSDMLAVPRLLLQEEAFALRPTSIQHVVTGAYD